MKRVTLLEGNRLRSFGVTIHWLPVATVFRRRPARAACREHHEQDWQGDAPASTIRCSCSSHAAPRSALNCRHTPKGATDARHGHAGPSARAVVVRQSRQTSQGCEPGGRDDDGARVPSLYNTALGPHPAIRVEASGDRSIPELPSSVDELLDERQATLFAKSRPNQTPPARRPE